MSKGLVFTNDNCVGCNRCVSACSCPGATIASTTDEGRNIISVDGSRCIACGACIDACEHHAREFMDDTADFFKDLKSGEDISVIFAPAFIANYPDEAEEIFGKLKTLGVNRFISGAFGADITTWGYLNYISKHHFMGGISQPCPAVVDYIEKYMPELISKLVPVQSPIMCAAIYAKKHMNISGKLAFIGPCIAKKKEIMSKRGMGLISYNVTFDHMMRYLRMIDVQPSAFCVEPESGLGSVYSMPGGLKENILWFLGSDALVRQVDGEKHLYHYLTENRERIMQKESPYVLYDLLNCTNGCLCGTGVEETITNEDTFIRMMKIKEKHINDRDNSPWSSALSYNERLDELNRHFGDLALEDYICTYTDNSSDAPIKYPDDKALDFIFEDMNKSAPGEREINCGACGYNSCREMAVAIYNGFNHKENCIHYVKNILEEFSIDFPTVFIIHTDDRKIRVMKYAGEEATKGWIETGLNLADYNTVIRDYIKRYVDDSDKKRVWDEVNYTSLLRRLENGNDHMVTYIRHPECGKSGYFQMIFIKKQGKRDIILAFHDVDEYICRQREEERKLKEALAAAKAADTAKATFLANMSHEIRTPINAILGMNTMILRESGQESVKEYAENIKTAADSLLAMVSDIIDFSKTSSGIMERKETKEKPDSSASADDQEQCELFHAEEAVVLAVDDVQMNLIVLKNLLKRSKIVPDVCISGYEAIQLAKEKKYDIIFLDAMMPGMSGKETLLEIRKNSAVNAETPIIVLTANAVTGAREEYLKGGFDDYLSKPLDSGKLEELILKYLPADKIHRCEGDDGPINIENEELSDKTICILEKLKNCAVISVDEGIKAVGDADTYLTIAGNFCDTADNRMKMIKDYFESGDIGSYTIQVHALKSSARLVGALGLSFHALALEKAGNENDAGMISAKTGELLSEYEAVAGILEDAIRAEDESKPLLPSKKFRRILSDIAELMEAFDFETGGQLFKELDAYSFEDEDDAVYRRLKALMADVDRDEILQLLGQYI